MVQFNMILMPREFFKNYRMWPRTVKYWASENTKMERSSCRYSISLLLHKINFYTYLDEASLTVYSYLLICVS